MGKLIVEIKWANKNLVEASMTIEDLKRCLYSSVHTFREVYQIREIRGGADNEQPAELLK